MRVFFSWSGSQSKRFAEEFAPWVSSVLQEVERYISTQDIQKGERWQPNIAAGLQDIEFGILVVTPGNKEAPWLLFEAGALSKNLERSRVIPLLCGVSDADLTGSPLAQFQYARLDKADVRDVIATINSSLTRPLDARALEETFELWWPKLEGVINKIEFTKDETPPKSKSQEERLAVLEQSVNELLHLTRRMAAPVPVTTTVFDAATGRSYLRGLGAVGAAGELFETPLPLRESARESER